MGKLIHEEYNCLGYYGFGNGISMVRDRSSYCNGCPQKKACWTMHKGRVAEFFPGLTERVEKLNKQGNEKELQKMIKKGQDPYIRVMTGNMQDALNIASGGEFADRGPLTLPYPFED